MNKTLICKSHITCNNGGCLHKKEHIPQHDCIKHVCFYDDPDGVNCSDSIKVSRKEKIQKIEENNFLSEID